MTYKFISVPHTLFRVKYILRGFRKLWNLHNYNLLNKVPMCESNYCRLRYINGIIIDRTT